VNVLYGCCCAITDRNHRYICRSIKYRIAFQIQFQALAFLLFSCFNSQTTTFSNLKIILNLNRFQDNTGQITLHDDDDDDDDDDHAQ